MTTTESPAPEPVPEILTWFTSSHYTDQALKPVAEAFENLAHALYNTLGVNEQIYFSLQHLLVAKDAAVRGAKLAIAQSNQRSDTLWTPEADHG